MAIGGAGTGAGSLLIDDVEDTPSVEMLVDDPPVDVPVEEPSVDVDNPPVDAEESPVEVDDTPVELATIHRLICWKHHQSKTSFLPKCC